ncbi:MAG: helix-turn-helix domain-containing protein [Planctomycetota bacterium]|jgi:AraC-like DNA-binding protein
MNRDLLAFHYRGRPGYNPGRARHVHDHHEFLYVFDGRGTQLTERGEEGCGAGDFFFFPAGQRHQSYVAPGKGFRAAVVSMRESLFAPGQDADRRCLSVLGQLRRRAERDNLLDLSAAGSEAVGRSMRALVGEFESRLPGHECAAKALMMDVLTAVLRDPRHRPEPAGSVAPLSHDALVEEVLWYLRTSYMSPVTVEDVLKFVPMSRSHFHAVFRRLTGKTLIGALREIRVERAGEMLAATDRGVLEVALACGFNSLSHFCHTFRALAGCSPREWRRRVAGERARAPR